MVLALALAALIILPRLAVGLNRLARWTIHEAIQTQQQIDRLESHRQHDPAQSPGD
jgi:hypothetical protein